MAEPKSTPAPAAPDSADIEAVKKLEAEVKRLTAVVKAKDKEIKDLEEQLDGEKKRHDQEWEGQNKAFNEEMDAREKAHNEEIGRLRAQVEVLRSGQGPDAEPQTLEARLRAYGRTVKFFGALHVPIHDGSLSNEALQRCLTDAKGDNEATELVGELLKLNPSERAAVRAAVQG